jgi:hypothetical protein
MFSCKLSRIVIIPERRHKPLCDGCYAEMRSETRTVPATFLSRDRSQIEARNMATWPDEKLRDPSSPVAADVGEWIFGAAPGCAGLQDRMCHAVQVLKLHT